MIDLGSLIPSEEGVKSTWQGIANDPIARVALMNFGTRLMVGGGGNLLSEVGAAAGHAGEGVAKSQEAILAQQNKEAAMAASEKDKSEDRKNRLEVAKIGADSRQEVANIRSAAMLERAAMIRGPQTQKEFEHYIKTRDTFFKKEKDNQILSRKTDDQILTEAEAYAKEALRGAREAVGGGRPSPLGGPDVPGVSSQNSPGAATGAGAAVSPPAGQAATGRIGKKMPTRDELMADPAFVKALEDPKFVEALKKKRPDLFPGLEMPQRNEAAVIVDELLGAAGRGIDHLRKGYEPTIRKSR